MTQLIQLKFLKETDNKLRWDARAEFGRFELYIPKWRVPVPWPYSISVKIEPIAGETQPVPRLGRNEIEKNMDLIAKPIIVNVTKLADHTETTHYIPESDGKEWEIGEPYIPFELTEDAEKLRLTVSWK